MPFAQTQNRFSHSAAELNCSSEIKPDFAPVLGFHTRFVAVQVLAFVKITVVVVTAERCPYRSLPIWAA